MVAGISDWILSLGGWVALTIVFLGPALESSAFLGFLFPGEIAVLLGGVLASHGRVSLAAVLVAAISGAIVGDTIGYFVGRRWGHQILLGVGRRIPFLRHRIDDHLASARAYLKRRGGAAVFLGRFTAALRVMVPGLAGMAEMPYGEFAAYNAMGGLLWGSAFVLLGYFAGAAWQRVAGDASKIGLGLLVVVLIGLVAGRLLKSVKERGEPLPDRLARIGAIAKLRSRFPRQSAWLATRVDTTSPRGFALSAVILTGAICGWIFLGLTQDVVANEEAVRSDPGITRFFVDHRAAWATSFMRGVTWLGSNATLIPVVVILGAYLLFRRKGWRPGVLLVAALAGANAWYRLVKPLVGRPRPPLALHLVRASGESFPSGHATAAIAVWGMSAVVICTGRSASFKAAAWTIAGLVVLLVGASRIYLGVHWWTDVMAGTALGGLWLCVLVGATSRGRSVPTQTG